MPEIVCPFCAEALRDPYLERCPNCGMFVPHELLIVLRASIERQTTATQTTATQTTATQSAVKPHVPTPLPLNPVAATGNSLPDIGVPIAYPPNQAANDPATEGTQIPSAPLAHQPSVLAWSEQNPANALAYGPTMVFRRIFVQSGMGLAVWSLAALPLGKWSYLPLAWFPAGLGLFVSLFGLESISRGKANKRDWTLVLATALICVFVMLVSLAV